MRPPTAGCQCCAVFSATSTVVLLLMGTLLRTQPEFVVEVHVKDSAGASDSFFGAAAIYTFFALWATASLRGRPPGYATPAAASQGAQWTGTLEPPGLVAEAQPLGVASQVLIANDSLGGSDSGDRG